MFIEWKKQNLKYMEIPNPVLPIKRTKFKLLPGINEVTDAEWEEMKKHLALEINSGFLVPFTPKSHSAPGIKSKDASSIIELTSNKAIEMVKNCISADTLNLWLEKETRETVLKEIRLKMEELGIKQEDIVVDDIDLNDLNDETKDSKDKSKKDSKDKSKKDSKKGKDAKDESDDEDSQDEE